MGVRCGPALRRRSEFGVEGAIKVMIEHPELGVPFDANDKTRGVGHRHPFDYAIFAARFDHQTLG